MLEVRPRVGSISRVAEFLSPAWIAELDDAARACDDFPPLVGPLVMEQVIRSSASGDVRYQIRIEAGRARVVADGEDRADIVLVTDLATAYALHTGVLRAQDALAAGALKVRGNPDVLVRYRELLGVLDSVFAVVREHTIFSADAVGAPGGASSSEQ